MRGGLRMRSAWTETEPDTPEFVFVVSNKGIALLAAVDAGLLTLTEEGIDTEKFEKFWTEYQTKLDQQQRKQVEYFSGMLQQQREQSAKNGTENCRINLRTAISAFIGFLLGACIVNFLRLL